MSTASRLLSCALPLITSAALLTGCPPVEPVEPEPPTPRSGVWGLHILDVSADGICAELAPAVEGRVVRLDVDAARSGALQLSLLGLDLYGGHGDWNAWADAELPLPWYYGFEDGAGIEPDVEITVDADDDEPVEEEEDHSEDDHGEDDVGGEDSGDPPPCVEYDEDEDEGYCGVPDPEPGLEPGIHVAFDAELPSAFAMHGLLSVTVSDGWGACSFDAIVDAAFISDEVDYGDDDFDDVEILPAEESVPGRAGEPVEIEVD